MNYLLDTNACEAETHAFARVLARYRVPEHAPLDDALIASIADARAMTVVTRNTRHFEPLGARCLDPWGG